MARRAVLVAAVAAVTWTAAAAQPAQGGRYDAQLCVATRADQAPTCGAAEVEVAGQRLSVRVADIVYRLALRNGELDVATSQGRMEIDEFSAAYQWVGDTLRFSDAAKNVRYEVRLGARRTSAKRKPGAS
jgi:hypothetical protein